MSADPALSTGLGRRAIIIGGVAAGAAFVAATADAPPANASPVGAPLWYNAETYSSTVKVTRSGSASTNTANFNSMVAEVSDAGGGTIYFPGGKDAGASGAELYKFNGVLRMKPNVTICGDGPSSTQFIWLDDSVPKEGYVAYFKSVTAAAIRNIGFNAGASQANTKAVSIKVDDSRGILIEGCRFTSMRRVIDIYNGSTNVGIKGNTFRDSTVGIAVSVLPQGGPAPSDIEISGNTFDGIIKDAQERDLEPPTAIYSQGVRVSATNNRISDSGDTGITFGKGADDSSATHNTIYTQLVSIYVGNGALRTRIIGNSLRSESDYGIHAYNRDGFPNAAYTIIEGNSISNCGKAGVHIEGADGVSCVGNVILNPGRRELPAANDRQRSGILVSNNASLNKGSYTGPASNFARNCNISSNTIIDDNDSSPTMRYGIHVRNASIGGMILSANTVGAAKNEKIRYPDDLPPADRVPAGTQWWSGTKPVWSNGTKWVDAAGAVVS